LVRIAPDGYPHQKQGRLPKMLLLVRQPPNTSPTSLILSMISSTSPKERPLWDVFWNHGVAGLAQQTAATDADARPPPSISTSTAQLGTSDIPIPLY
jgi:hypothetical protein